MIIFATIVFIWFLFDMSATKYDVSPFVSSLHSFSQSALLAIATTLAPDSARHVAAERPIPLLAPVTNTFFPLTSKRFFKVDMDLYSAALTSKFSSGKYFFNLMSPERA